MRTLQDHELDSHGGGFGLVGAGLGALTGGVGSALTQYNQTGTIHPGNVLIASGLGAVSGFSGGLAATMLASGNRLAAAGLGIYSVGTGAGAGVAVSARSGGGSL